MLYQSNRVPPNKVVYCLRYNAMTPFISASNALVLYKIHLNKEIQF